MKGWRRSKGFPRKLEIFFFFFFSHSKIICFFSSSVLKTSVFHPCNIYINMLFENLVRFVNRKICWIKKTLKRVSAP